MDIFTLEDICKKDPSFFDFCKKNRYSLLKNTLDDLGIKIKSSDENLLYTTFNDILKASKNATTTSIDSIVSLKSVLKSHPDITEQILYKISELEKGKDDYKVRDKLNTIEEKKKELELMSKSKSYMEIIEQYFYSTKYKEYPQKPEKECETIKDINSCSYGNVGGHGNIIDYNKDYCAKKIIKDKKNKTIINDNTFKEISFYETIYHMMNSQYYKHDGSDFLHIINFIEKPLMNLNNDMINTCYKNNDIYFNLKNLKSNKGNDVIVADFKIGNNTSIYPDTHSKIKLKRMESIDKFFSISDEFGFRCEGISGAISIINMSKTVVVVENTITNDKYKVTFSNCDKSRKYCNKIFLRNIRLPSKTEKQKIKFQNYILNTMILFKIIFQKHDKLSIKKFLNLLKNYRDACSQNEINIKKIFNDKDNDNDKSKDIFGISMIGSSLLIISGDELSLAPIDFAHSYFITYDYVNRIYNDVEYENWKRMHITACQNYKYGIEKLITLLDEYLDYYNDKISFTPLV